MEFVFPSSIYPSEQEETTFKTLTIQVFKFYKETKANVISGTRLPLTTSVCQNPLSSLRMKEEYEGSNEGFETIFYFLIF